MIEKNFTPYHGKGEELLFSEQTGYEMSGIPNGNKMFNEVGVFNLTCNIEIDLAPTMHYLLEFNEASLKKLSKKLKACSPRCCLHSTYKYNYFKS